MKVAEALDALCEMHKQCIDPPDELFLGIAELIVLLAHHAEGSLRSDVLDDYETQIDQVNAIARRG